MRRSVMAIHAIHRPDLVMADVIRECFLSENGHYPLRIRQPHPRNLLTLLIRCNVLHTVSDRHVPVNATDRTVGWIAATHFEDHAYRKRRVRPVAEEKVECPVQVADKFSRPMALVTGLLSRAKVADRRLNRTRELVEQRRIKRAFGGRTGDAARTMWPRDRCDSLHTPRARADHADRS